MAADYEQASGNKVDHSLIPYAALRQKAISAIASGAVPDMIFDGAARFDRCARRLES
jgi:ABC-type glycerol-3-phosphate transport system substrate-binding protein